MVHEYAVTIAGETRVWMTLEYAFTDLFSRGYMQAEWTLEKQVKEDAS